MENKTILVPTDFSEVCNNAVNHGLGLAKHFGYTVVILHVINKETKTYMKNEGIDMDGLEQRLKDLATEKSDFYGVEANYVLKEGNIFDIISETAKEKNAVLVILGTHGKVGFQRLTGSYALKVISNTDSPTIVVQKKELNSKYKNIIFPVTVTSQDRQKVGLAISIARTFDATIHIIPKFESEKMSKTKIMNVVKQIKDVFAKNNIKHIDKVTEPGGGNFAKQVIDYSVVNDADLIMIMTGGDNASLPMFDSWDEQLVFNSSQIPVICLNTARLSISRAGL